MSASGFRIYYFLFLFGLPGALFAQKNTSNSNTSIPLTALLQNMEEWHAVSFLYEAKILENYTLESTLISNALPFDKNLQQITKATDLIFIQLSESAFAIRKKENEIWVYGTICDWQKRPLPGATIQITNSASGTTTDVNGHFRLPLKPGKWNLYARYVGKKEQQKVIEVTPGDSLPLHFYLEDFPFMEEIIVAGSRISASSLLETASPASVLNGEEQKDKSFYGISEFLQYNIPSFHSTNQTIADGTDHLDPATLKGLGPDQLLVLINGKRRHQSALVNVNGSIGKGSVATDLNAIPLAAIEKIEVLRDGASVHYGSDAIAGVINIVLKENTNYTDLQFKSGLSSKGDGFMTNLSANSGFSLNKKGAFLHLSLDYLMRNAVNRSGNYTGPIFGDERDEQNEYRDSFFDQTTFKDQEVMSIGGAAISNASIFYNSKIPINEKLHFYSFGGYSYRFGTSGGFYRFPYQKAKQSGIYPWGFSPQLKTNINDQSITLGICEQRKDWKIDISNTTGQNGIQFNVLNSNNASLGLLSPNAAKAGGFKYLQNVTNLDLNKTLKKKLPIYMGIGAEFRLENFKQLSGEEESWKNYQDSISGFRREGGIQMFPGFRPENSVDKYRYNVGAYANVEMDINQALRIGAAGRFEFYNDFGHNLSWKSYARYHLSEKNVLKGSINTGFRAPSLPQVYYNSLSYQYISGEKGQEGVAVANFNNESPVARQFGIDPLQAERSTNFHLGFASSWSDHWSFSLDAYSIAIKDRIVITGRFSHEDDPSFAQILDPLDVSYAQFFTNAIDTKTRGLDLEIHYVVSIGASKIKMDFLANASKTVIAKNEEGQRIIHSSDLLEGFEAVLFNREEIGRIESAQPSNKLIFHLLHEYKKIQTTLAFTRFGAVHYIHPNDGEEANWVLNEFTGMVESRDQIFTPKWLTDLKIAYRFSNRMSLSVGGNNIFNVYPDTHRHSDNTAHGVFKYSRRVQQFGVRGGYWYLSAGLRL